MTNWGGSRERKVGLILTNQWNCLTNRKQFFYQPNEEEKSYHGLNMHRAFKSHL